jgi:hypothetical protein
MPEMLQSATPFNHFDLIVWPNPHQDAAFEGGFSAACRLSLQELF